jgi:hypothetical protein
VFENRHVLVVDVAEELGSSVVDFVVAKQSKQFLAERLDGVGDFEGSSPFMRFYAMNVDSVTDFVGGCTGVGGGEDVDVVPFVSELTRKRDDDTSKTTDHRLVFRRKHSDAMRRVVAGTKTLDHVVFPFLFKLRESARLMKQSRERLR